MNIAVLSGIGFVIIVAFIFDMWFSRKQSKTIERLIQAQRAHTSSMLDLQRQITAMAAENTRAQAKNPDTITKYGK